MKIPYREKDKRHYSPELNCTGGNMNRLVPARKLIKNLKAKRHPDLLSPYEAKMLLHFIEDEVETLLDQQKDPNTRFCSVSEANDVKRAIKKIKRIAKDAR
jgi:hypothetical protein